jgi:hypothetical protein
MIISKGTVGALLGILFSASAVQAASVDAVLTAAGLSIRSPLETVTCFTPGRPLLLTVAHASTLIWTVEMADGSEVQAQGASMLATFPAQPLTIFVTDLMGTAVAQADLQPEGPDATCTYTLDETAYRTATAAMLRAQPEAPARADLFDEAAPRIQDAGAWMCRPFGSRCVYPGQAPQPHPIANPTIPGQLGMGIRF